MIFPVFTLMQAHRIKNQNLNSLYLVFLGITVRVRVVFTFNISVIIGLKGLCV